MEASQVNCSRDARDLNSERADGRWLGTKPYPLNKRCRMHRELAERAADHPSKATPQ